MRKRVRKSFAILLAAALTAAQLPGTVFGAALAESSEGQYTAASLTAPEDVNQSAPEAAAAGSSDEDTGKNTGTGSLQDTSSGSGSAGILTAGTDAGEEEDSDEASAVDPEDPSADKNHIPEASANDDSSESGPAEAAPVPESLSDIPGEAESLNGDSDIPSVAAPDESGENQEKEAETVNPADPGEAAPHPGDPEPGEASINTPTNKKTFAVSGGSSPAGRRSSSGNEAEDGKEDEEEAEAAEPEEYGTGNLEARFSFPEDYKLQSDGTALPSSYITAAALINAPYDQGSSQLCWAYTANNMAEISMMKKYGDSTGKIDGEPVSYTPDLIAKNFLNTYRSDRGSLTSGGNTEAGGRDFTAYYISENQAGAKAHYVKSSSEEFDQRYKNVPGRLDWTTFELARWSAPAGGGADSFNCRLMEGEDAAAHLQNAYWVPNTDVDAIKKLIYEYGSVGLQIRYKNVDTASGTIYFEPEGGYRYNADHTQGVDHLVTLVGWDDSIPASKFEYHGKKPTAGGGFYVKNSYGTAKGENEPDGYFYLSYQDGAFQKDSSESRIAVAYDFEKPSNYDYNYGYDGSNFNSTISTKRVYTVFTAAQEEGSGKMEVLKAIGVGLASAGEYKFTVYYYDTKTQYINRFPMESFTAEIPYSGYHTIELRDPVLWYRGDRIAVAVERVNGNEFSIFVDENKGYNLSSDGSLKSQSLQFISYGKYGECFFTDSDGKLVSGNSAKDGLTQQKEIYLYNSYTKKMDKPRSIGGVRGGFSARVKVYSSSIKDPGALDQNDISIALEKYVWYYTGSNIYPVPVVKMKDTGYLIMRNQYDDKDGVDGNGGPSYANSKEEGIAAVIVRGDGKAFSGEISAAYKIVKEQVSMRSCKIYGVEDQKYQANGDYKLNHIVVRYRIPETKQYLTLREGVDYRIGSVEGQNLPGKKNTIMITGIGAFRHTVKKKFKIQKKEKPKPICDKSIQVKVTYDKTVWADDTNEELPLVPEIEYDGSRHKPTVTLYDTETGKTLVEGVDYKKVKYSGNKGPGLASIIIRAKGGSGASYSGTMKRYFLIRPLKITTDAVLAAPKIQKYTGNPIRPKPRVTLYGTRISPSNLYVIYLNNVGSSSYTITSQMIVFGKKKYDGYVGYTTFRISPTGT